MSPTRTVAPTTRERGSVPTGASSRKVPLVEPRSASVIVSALTGWRRAAGRCLGRRDRWWPRRSGPRCVLPGRARWSGRRRVRGRSTVQRGCAGCHGRVGSVTAGATQRDRRPVDDQVATHWCVVGEQDAPDPDHRAEPGGRPVVSGPVATGCGPEDAVTRASARSRAVEPTGASTSISSGLDDGERPVRMALHHGQLKSHPSTVGTGCDEALMVIHPCG